VLKNIVLGCSVDFSVVLLGLSRLHHLALAAKLLEFVFHEGLSAFVDLNLRLIPAAVKVACEPILRLLALTLVDGLISLILEVELIVLQVVCLQLHLFRRQFQFQLSDVLLLCLDLVGELLLIAFHLLSVEIRLFFVSVKLRLEGSLPLLKLFL